MPSNFKIPTSEAASIWTQTSDKDFNNGTFTNTTITGIGKNARINIDMTELNQWNKKNPIGTPIRRYCAGMAAVYGTDNVVLYGGAYYSESINYLNDTWIYNTRNNTWLQKYPSTSPSARYGHIMASIWDHDKVLCYGGYPNYKDTWTYDLGANTWTEMYPPSDPGIKNFNAMVSIWGTDKVMLFGSYPSSDETWIYDYSDNNWTKKSPSSRPAARYGQAMASVHNDDKVIMFGGIVDLNPLNDTWVYDLNTDTWTLHKPKNAPAPRYYAGMAPAYGTNRVMLFGGLGRFIGYTDETWIYDLSLKRWERKTPSIKPQGRYCLSLAAIYGTDKILLFGGSNGTFNNFFNDTWIYKYFLKTKNGTYVSIPFDTGANSTFIRLTWNVSIPSNTSIKFQLKTAANKPELAAKEFLGPDGSISSYYTSSSSDIWLGHYGDRWVQYKAYFNMSVICYSPSLKNITITYNCLPETELISPINRSILIINQPIFKWNSTDIDSVSLSTFQVLISNNHLFDEILFDSGEQSTINHIWHFPNGTKYAIMPEGTWYWKVRMKDSDGDWGLFSPTWKFSIDSKVPISIINVPKNNTFYHKLTKISGKGDDFSDGVGLKKIEISIKNLNNNKFWNGFNWNKNETLLRVKGTTHWEYDTSIILWNSGNKYRIQSQATDNATNIENPTFGKIFIFDNENVVFSNSKPSPNIESPIEEVTVGITISDVISGVNSSTIEYSISSDDGVTWKPCVPVIGYKDGKNINVTLNLTFPNGTANRIKWRAADIAGNGPTESIAYIVKVNTWLQTFIPKVKLLSPKNGATIPTNSVKLSWMLKNKDLLNISYDVYFDNVYPPNVSTEGLMTTDYTIDALVDGETYYWTVIPKLGGDEGWCVSGVWWFTVNTTVPFPTVTLTHPKNGSIIPSSLPTLVWLVEYEGTENVTFDIYLSSNKHPGIETTDHQKTYYLPETNLEDNTTYYWKIIPMAGGVQGPESRTWSFTIKRDYIPHFELILLLEPAVIGLGPSEITYVKASVRNAGELTDTISLSIEVPTNAEVGALVNEPIMMEIPSEDVAVFNITVTTTEDAQKKDFILTVTALSEKAPEYGLNVEEHAILKVIILGPEKSEMDKPTSEIWIIFIIFIVIIIILMIVVLLIKRRKRSKQKLSLPENVTIKPIEAPTLDKLKGESAPKPTLAPPPQGSTTPTPKLASLKTVGQTPAPQQIPQPTLAPKLPPAQTQETKIKAGEKTRNN